jgi:hypothetical protein
MKTRIILNGIILAMVLLSCQQKQGQVELLSKEENKNLFDSIRNQLHISPGWWRPLFNSEQIFWISPPWASSQYIYVDFPEAIFIGETPAYLSHVSGVLPTLFNYKLPLVEWKRDGDRIYYERNLGDYMDFGGEVMPSGTHSASMKLWITNKTDEPLEDITLQTCGYLYPIKEFAAVTNTNKHVHLPDSGWVSLDELWPMPDDIPEKGVFGVGWRGGKKVSDLPFIIASDESGEHHVAWTWFEHTVSFIGNIRHPCFHADPFFPDLAPGETAAIHGEMVFFEGSLEDFGTYLMDNYSLSCMTDIK